jgi:hypothetical protein
MDVGEIKKQTIHVPIIAAIFTIVGVVFNVIVFITNIPIPDKQVTIEWYRENIIMNNIDDVNKYWKIRIVSNNNGKSVSFEKKQTLIYQLDDVKITHYYILNNELDGNLTQGQNCFELTFNKWKHKEKFEFEVLVNCNNSIKPTILLNTHNTDIESTFTDLPNMSNTYLPQIFKHIMEWNTFLKYFCLVISIMLIIGSITFLVKNFINSCRYYNWHIENYGINSYLQNLKNTSLHILPVTIYNADKEKGVKNKDYRKLLNISMIIGLIIIMFYAIVSFLCLYHYLNL